MRRAPLRLVPPADHSDEAGYREWHAAIFGQCACCGERGRLERHHVVKEQHVRAQHGDPWDLRNSLELGVWCACHRQHTVAAQKLPLTIVHDAAINFAVDLYGPAASAYLSRYYT